MKVPLDRLDRLVPRTLTARLVVTAVALVALVGILVAASATIAMRSAVRGSDSLPTTTAPASPRPSSGRVP